MTRSTGTSGSITAGFFPARLTAANFTAGEASERLVGNLKSNQATLDASLYNVFERDYGYHLIRAEQTMEASLANAHELELLHMVPPASVLRIERLTYNQQNILLEYVVSAYRGDLYKFHLTLQ